MMSRTFAEIGCPRGAPDKEYFEARYVPVTETGCWIWTGKMEKQGYGSVMRGKRILCQKAHRFSYELHKGPIPPGMCVCHKCDVRACVNPEHLFLGTVADNNADKMAKGRDRKSPQHGENNNRPTKLKEVQVIAILKDTRTQKEIAAEYGVGVKTIGAIKQGVRWAYLQKSEQNQ